MNDRSYSHQHGRVSGQRGISLTSKSRYLSSEGLSSLSPTRQQSTIKTRQSEMSPKLRKFYRELMIWALVHDITHKTSLLEKGMLPSLPTRMMMEMLVII